jgi:hypothetical protein
MILKKNEIKALKSIYYNGWNKILFKNKLIYTFEYCKKILSTYDSLQKFKINEPNLLQAI